MKWIPRGYTITYIFNNKDNQIATRKYTVETRRFDVLDLASLLNANTETFMGWYTNEDFAGYKYTEIAPGHWHYDKTLYAKWHKVEINTEGQIANPYIITSEAELRELAEKVNRGDSVAGKYYQQSGDITITGGDWVPIGNRDHGFNSNYDGGGFTISGININNTEDYQGLFGSVLGTAREKRGLIQNIVLTGSIIKGANYTGGIVGYLNGGHVKNCHVRDDVTVTGKIGKEGIGGVVGYLLNPGKVANCTSMATVSTGNSVGSVIGYVSASNADYVKNCFSVGKAPLGTVLQYENEIRRTTARAYRVKNSDGTIIMPDEVSETDGFMYNGAYYYKEGAKVPLGANLDQREGYEIEISYDSNVVPREDYGMYILTVPAKSVTLTVQEKPITYEIFYDLTTGQSQRQILRATR